MQIFFRLSTNRLPLNAAPFEPSKPLNEPTVIPVPVVDTDDSDFVDENHVGGLRLKVGYCRDTVFIDDCRITRTTVQRMLT